MMMKTVLIAHTVMNMVMETTMTIMMKQVVQMILLIKQIKMIPKKNIHMMKRKERIQHLMKLLLKKLILALQLIVMILKLWKAVHLLVVLALVQSLVEVLQAKLEDQVRQHQQQLIHHQQNLKLIKALEKLQLKTQQTQKSSKKYLK